MQLLFLPGFSMAEAVTNVSGRGVGLDVVATKIGSIGGTVVVESTIGGGTTWRLRIPLTLAIISAIIVASAGELYAIPAVNVLEFVAVGGSASGAMIEYVGRAPVLRRRGALLPLVGLRDVLQLADRQGPGPQAGAVIAVLQADTRLFGLVLDRVLDTKEIVVKSLTARLRGVGVYAGATLLGDGRVALILDVQGIARQWMTEQLPQASPEPGEAPRVAVTVDGQVLVVGIGDRRRVAIPLAAVTRLERVRADAVEQVGGGEVLQYRGAIAALVRLDQVLGVSQDPSPADLQEQELFVVIVTRGARTVAIAITEVLDIMDDDPTGHTQIDDRATACLTVLGDKVTELIDVRQVVLRGDPSFFGDDDGAQDLCPPNAAPVEPRAVGA